MKITDPQVIQQGERDLIDSVQEDLDLDTIREILKERMSVAALSSKGGQIVVHNNKIAFRLDFEINLSGSLLFDREGNFIDEAGALGSDSDDTVSPLVQDREEGGLYDDPDHDDLEDDDLMDDEINGMDLEEEDDLSVDLPDYGIDVEPEGEDDTEAPDDGMEELDDELELAAEELTMEDLEEEEEDFLDDEGVDLEEEEDDFQASMDEDDGDNPFGDDDPQDLDDDINDILKESREFWEQKKES